MFEKEQVKIYVLYSTPENTHDVVLKSKGNDHKQKFVFRGTSVDADCDSFVREETHRELRNTTTFVFQDGGFTTSRWFGVHVTKASLPVYTTLMRRE